MRPVITRLSNSIIINLYFTSQNYNSKFKLNSTLNPNFLLNLILNYNSTSNLVSYLIIENFYI